MKVKGKGLPFAEYAVRAASVADFLARYYDPKRYTGRGEDYASRLLASYEAEYKQFGYIFISQHDSVSGRYVAWFGEE